MEIAESLIPYTSMILALVLGMLLGIERTFAGKTAGLRTYGLVSMGSALFIVVTNIVLEDFIGLTSFDPTRVAAGIITGIGFIGAGLILFREHKLRGLTTAAGLWVACGIGIACGFGLYMIATFATFLTLFAFTALWFVEDRVRHLKQKSNLAHGSEDIQ
ncbi:MAG: hypothetical protein COV34_02040 [Candidatus Zambryskibacteria bacterium CG10_big_fil_rev_8_21_14_0_10_42_12]|uniref:MgtC/SapB/SrpB/YhiD N-terminal domain-containing protein n=1 Tax=Candidatus Zambryskibacteria bacterium CG10_big_fil_rev_8_21_14_0_10_42_12 TaxID=1975115 RepID=A0A2H0QWJ9_9BACT|nr:MAG: hypothetical protein COV34_02040 [Candidatus Zambryskibacteria bacterium CG10_big_fil_rev_8_21_14_0_10_42_12]